MLAQESLQLPVRRRVLKIPQSKDGCSTCKKRKVRCDLNRPACQRCLKSGRLCAGYRDPDVNKSALSLANATLTHLSSTPAFDIASANIGFEHIRLTRLGCSVLHNDATQQYGVASAFWNSVPMLGQTDPLVAASMAAFGASIEASLSPSPDTAIAYARYCAIALQLVQSGISETASFSVSLIVACILLAVSEIQMGQDLAALSHLEGTLLVLQRRQQLLTSSSNDEPDSQAETSFKLGDDVEIAGAVLDIGTASYALGRPARLPRLTTQSANDSSNLSNQHGYLNEHRLLETLHASYAFSSNHFQLRYVPNHLVSKDAFIQQNRRCAKLFQCIQEIGPLVTITKSPQVIRALTLRAQCTACLIYIQNVFEPMETSYDQFLASFKSIVEDAETILSSIEPRPLKISLDLGLVKPLFFTAIKCRDLNTRLKAVRLLTKTGREGPFDGQRLAAMAYRGIQLEEGELKPFSLALQDRSASSIPERLRLHGVDIEIPHSLESMALGVSVTYSRCKNMDKMLDTDDPNYYKDDEKHWEVWHEYLPIPLHVG